MARRRRACASRDREVRLRAATESQIARISSHLFCETLDVLNRYHSGRHGLRVSSCLRLRIRRDDEAVVLTLDLRNNLRECQLELRVGHVVLYLRERRHPTRIASGRGWFG